MYKFRFRTKIVILNVWMLKSNKLFNEVLIYILKFNIL